MVAELVLLLQLGPRAVVTRCAAEVLPEPVLPEFLAVVAELQLEAERWSGAVLLRMQLLRGW